MSLGTLVGKWVLLALTHRPSSFGCPQVSFLAGPPSVPRGIGVAYSRPLACHMGLGPAPVTVPRHLTRVRGRWAGRGPAVTRRFVESAGETRWLVLLSSHDGGAFRGDSSSERSLCVSSVCAQDCEMNHWRLLCRALGGLPPTPASEESPRWGITLLRARCSLPREPALCAGPRNP